MPYALSLTPYARMSDALADIAQSIAVILATPKGSKIHDPEFGCDLWNAVDRPVGQVPAAVAEVVRALRRDEPRVAVESVEPDFSAAAAGRVILSIRYRVLATGESAATTVTL